MGEVGGGALNNRSVSENAKLLRKNMTDAERLLWKYLRSKQVEGVKFRRQEPIGKYIVDFVSFEKRVVIEIDGGQHSDHQLKDAARDEWLKSQGFFVLRFWNHEVLRHIDAVVLKIADTVSTLPDPSHKGRGQ